MFEREIELIGKDKFERLKKVSVMVVGIGGVGGYAVESLIRAGIHNIIIVDFDIVDITNKNRQIIATDKTIGKKKVEVMKDRIHDINKDVNVDIIDYKLTSDNIEDIFKYNIDFLIDACDDIKVKEQIILKCLKNNIDFISSMGTGNKLNPSLLKICELKNTSYDPLAKRLRKFVKENNIKSKIWVVSSEERPIKTTNNKVLTMNTVCATAGLLCSNYVINKVIDMGG
mgnify:FL=1